VTTLTANLFALSTTYLAYSFPGLLHFPAAIFVVVNRNTT